MNTPFSQEALEQLIMQIRMANPKREPLYLPPGAWKSELLKYPERFRIDDDGLSYLGYLVGIIGNGHETDEFLCLANKVLKGE